MHLNLNLTRISNQAKNEWMECSLAQSMSQVFKNARVDPPRPATFYLKRAARQLAVRAKIGGIGRIEGETPDARTLRLVLYKQPRVP